MTEEKRSWQSRTLAAFGAYHPLEELRWGEIHRLGLLPAVLRARRHEPEFPQALEQEQRLIAKRRLLIRAVTAQVTDHLAGKAAHVVLKGEPLAQELYPDPMMRVSGDVDLLVLPGDLEYVEELLAQIDFFPLQPWSRARLATNNQWVFVHKEHETPLELHWRLALPALPDLPIPSLFETRRLVHMDRRWAAPVLDPAWQFIHLALHFHHHMGFARGLLDLASWLDVHGHTIEPEVVFERAASAGLSGIIQWPLHTLARHQGEIPPLYKEEIDRTVHLWSGLSERALRDCMIRRSPSPWERALQEVQNPLPTSGSMVLRCAQASLVDGGVLRKANHMIRPLLMGPHRYGRWLSRLSR